MKPVTKTDRRTFLQRTLAAGLLASPLRPWGRAAAQAPAQEKPAAVDAGAAEPAADLPKIKEYRALGRTGFLASDISSGGPMNEALLRALIQSGVTYIDTAESYGRGQSETVTGNVVREFDRRKLFVTTKVQIRQGESKEVLLARVRKCLERLQMEYIDCLMIHKPETSALVASEAFHGAAKQLKSESRVRYLGISQHGGQWNDVPETMEQVALAAVADGRFDVLLFVYNFIQQEMGQNILRACRDKKIGTVLMKTNPVGVYLEIKAEADRLAKEGKPEDAYLKNILPRLKEKADQAEAFIRQQSLNGVSEVSAAATRFVLSHADVHTAIMTFNSFADAKNFLALSGGRFTAKDAHGLALWRDACASLYCRHACGLCQSQCPQRVPVNTIMRYNHYFTAQGREKYAMAKYLELQAPKPGFCQDCPGYCERACPYGVPIQGLLVLAHRRLTFS